MDKLKNMAGNLGNADDYLKDLSFPISKDELLSKLEQKGVPSQVTDKIRDLDVSQFNSVDDVKSKLGSLIG